MVVYGGAVAAGIVAAAAVVDDDLRVRLSRMLNYYSLETQWESQIRSSLLNGQCGFL